jgi:ABC-type lipoprotein export system ATPase subunit
LTAEPVQPLAVASLVEARGLSHLYGTPESGVAALRQVDLELRPGERVALMGRSGSGKTTLLGILAGLETPTLGRVVVAGHDLTRLSRRERDAFRRRVVGYVWQEAETGLLPALSVLQNVMLPMLAAAGSPHERLDFSLQLLEALRLSPRANDRPSELPPAQIQRLALAVALANRPLLLLADELTAGLDWPTGGELMSDLMTLLDSTATAAIVVSHDQRVQRHVERVVVLRDGVTSGALKNARGLTWTDTR